MRGVEKKSKDEFADEETNKNTKIGMLEKWKEFDSKMFEESEKDCLNGMIQNMGKIQPTLERLVDFFLLKINKLGRAIQNTLTDKSKIFL